MIQWDLCVIGASGRWGLLAPAGLSNTGALQKSVASLEMLVLSTQCASSQKNKAGIIIPLTMFWELWEKKCCLKWVLFVTEASWGFLCSKCCCNWYIILEFVTKSRLCSFPTLLGIRSQWTEVRHDKPLTFDGRNKRFTFVVVFNKYWWEENGFKCKNFSTFMQGLLSGSSFLKGRAALWDWYLPLGSTVLPFVCH